MALLEWNGKTVKKDENVIFQAVIASADPLDPNLDLGSDPREYMKIDVLRPTPNLSAQDKCLIVEDGQQIRIVKRMDNPVDPYVTFYAMKITAKDQ